MIDLNELQKEIDDLLDNETNESLLKWYMSKKFPNYQKVMGEGELFAIDNDVNSKVEQVPVSNYLNVENNCNLTEPDLHIAA